MNRITSVSVAALFVAGLVLPGYALEPAGSSGQPGSAYDAPAGTTSKTGATFERGRHEMTGTVSDIDHNKGLLSFRTEGMDLPTLKLHFPPQAIRDLKDGDRITVQVALQSRPGGTSAYDMPKHEHGETGMQANERGEHTMTGTVTDVDRDKGLLSFKTDEGTLKLHFPPDQVKNLKDGDRIAVQLAYWKAGSTSGTGGAHKGTNPSGGRDINQPSGETGTNAGTGSMIR